MTIPKNFISDNITTPRPKIGSSELKNEKDDIPINENIIKHLIYLFYKYEFIKNINDNNYLKQLYLDTNFLNKFMVSFIFLYL